MSVHNAEHLANDYDNLYGSGEIVGDAYDDNAYNSANENIYWSGNNATSVDDAVGANYSSSGEIKQRGGRYNTFSTRKSMDDSVLGDARMSRIAMTEAAIRREMFKDCTFTPNIKNLPSSYGAMKDLGSNFQTRVAKWQRDKEAEKQKKIAASSQAELTDCTFHPRISRNSEKAVKEIRGEAEEDANERLYKSSNLYAEHRMRQIELERQKQEEKDRLECSFQPKLATQKDLYQVNARFHLTASQKNPHETQKDPKLKECTFTPKVNGIKPSMSSAKLYTSTNVVDRLTRPLNPQPQTSADDGLRAFDSSFSGEKGGNVMDMASFLNSLNGQNSGYSTPNSTSQKGRARSAFSLRRSASSSGFADDKSEQSHSARPSAEDIKARRKKFEQFIGRQENITRRRQENLNMIERTITPNFKPTICKKSVLITAEKFRGEESSFLNRVERQVQRRLSKDQGLEIASESNCTFQPKINKKSERLAARSPFDMSLGDSKRQETNRRLLKLEREQAALSGSTFKPKISTLAKELGKSHLQLSSEKTNFLEKYHEQLLEREKERQLELQRREEAEREGCTFVPETRDCPAYVKRIAKSMAIVKAARGNSSVYSEEKPQWK